jgi:CHAT domain-containing protein
MKYDAKRIFIKSKKGLMRPAFLSFRNIFLSVFYCLFVFVIVFGCLTASPASSAEDSGLKPQMSAPANTKTPATFLDRGALSFRQGAFGDAAANFEAAARSYEREANGPKRCEALIMLAQASLFTGQHRKALEASEKALTLARELNDGHQTAAALGAIGNVHLAMGNEELATKYLNEGLAAARESGYQDVAAVILNNVGNMHSARKRYSEAQVIYAESAAQAERAGNPTLAQEAMVNAATVAFRAGMYADAGSLLERATDRLRVADDSYAKAHSLINAGLVYSGLRAHLPEQKQSLVEQSYRCFSEALAVAHRMNDQRTVSYAYGYLGQLYEDEQQYQEALELTRRAIFAAQKNNSTEALYRWHWQDGRILVHMGKLDEAIASYRLAIRDLRAVREEMSSCYADPELSYQKTAGAVCLEMVDLLLKRAARLREGESGEPYLAEARDTLEVVKVLELREYFRDDCIDAARSAETKLDMVSKKTVVVYPVLFPDRAELLVSFAGHLKRFTLAASIDELTKEIRAFRRTLVKRTTWEFLPHAQKLYDWIVRPLEKDLDTVQPDTLVFVPDGPLRTIPMAALHDGRQFLINRYAIAITPGLYLTDPHPLRTERTKVLYLGLTQPVQGFPGLPYVAEELKSIKALYGGEMLLNDEFRLAKVEEELKKEPFSIVHVASHGQFGTNIGDTFILAFDQKFTMDRLSQYVGLFKFREEPLDMLVLSACETAAGDDRAALGLAGVAVRAGAGSALATLWHINDPASYELVVEFYRQLRSPSSSRAVALRAAQLKLLNDQRYDHPGYWAPFLLINNWL